MTREVTDQLYIDLGYFTPEDYYTYQAEAQIAQASQATMSVTVGVIKQTNCAMSTQFSVTSTISHIEGADLFAFANAQLAAQVSVIKENNVQMASNFSVACDAVRGIYISAQADAVASMSTANLRVRYNQAAVTAAFSISVDAVYNRNVSAALTSQATVSAQLNKLINGNSTIQSSASLGAVVGLIKGGQSTISSAFTTSNFISEWVNSGAHVFTRTGDAGVTGVVKKFGTGAFRISGANAFGSTPDTADWDLVVGSTKIWTIDFWIYPTAAPSTTIPILGQRTSTSSLQGTTTNGWGVFYQANGVLFLNIQIGDANLTASRDIVPNQWNHIRIQSDGVRIGFYVDGSRGGLVTWNGAYVTSTQTFKIGNATANSVPTLYIDSLDYQFGVTADQTLPTTITVPTGERTTPTQYSKLLMNFNGEVFDASGVGIKTFNAALSSQATVSALAGKSVVANASITSSATVSAQINKLQQASSSLSAQGFVVAAISRLRPGIEFVDVVASLSAGLVKQQQASAGLNSQFSVSADVVKTFGPVTANLNSSASTSINGNLINAGSATLSVQGFVLAAVGRIRPEVADLTTTATMTINAQKVVVSSGAFTSQFIQTVDVTKVFGPITAGLTATTSLTAQARSIPSGAVEMSASASLTANNTRTRVSAVSVSSTATVSAQGRLTRRLASTISSQFNLTASITRTKQFAANLPVIASELTAVSKIGRTLIHCSVVSQINVNARITSGSIISANSTTTLTARVGVTKRTSIVMTSTSLMVTEGDAGIIGQANLTAQSTLTATSRQVKVARATITCQASVVATGRVIRSAIILQASSGTMTVNARRLRTVESNPGAQFTLVGQITKVVGFRAQLQCQGFLLSTGKVINLEASATWIVPQETRSWNIPYEVRDYTIAYENRLHFIQED